MVQFKVSYGSDMRRMSFRTPPTFADVRETLMELYGLSAVQMDALALSYQDGEGDWVRISCESELQLSMEQHPSDQLLRLRLEKNASLDGVVGLLQRPEIEAYISKQVTALMAQPNFDNLVQEMLPSVMSIMVDTNAGLTPTVLGDTPTGLHPVASEEFSHSAFAEADPQSSITLPSISMEDVNIDQPGLLLSESDTSSFKSDIFDKSSGNTDELLGQIASMLIDGENDMLESLASPFSSLDFSAYSAMVEEDHVSALLNKVKPACNPSSDLEVEAEEAKLEEVENEANISEKFDGATELEVKPQQDSSAEILTQELLKVPASPFRRQSADAIACSFVLLEDTTNCEGTSEQYDEEELLQSLEELGFTNGGRNRTLLELFRGNLGMVVETLLNGES